MKALNFILDILLITSIIGIPIYVWRRPKCQRDIADRSS
jgi:hypothetical protein